MKFSMSSKDLRRLKFSETFGGKLTKAWGHSSFPFKTIDVCRSDKCVKQMELLLNL